MPMDWSRRTLLRAGFGVAALAGTLLMSGCGSGTTTSAPTSNSAAPESSTTAAAPAGAVTVDVKNMRFSPDAITIKVGGTVTWNFADRFPHAVQGIGDSAMGINSPIFNTGKWSHTFTVPGTYRYLCPLHPDMHGTVTVQ
ncbi:plastocyanin/azurin family copper-binding protein [Nocardia miyunensis]|uniref:plastocyanin/azurin family copper-binding protein n=1 Tax=Nocardia miyunensis TaxID=282684 RepID=UPI00082A1BAD|nr:plastocyanin/azurin family copper-binding protein [Nocardia miyunensis]